MAESIRAKMLNAVSRIRNTYELRDLCEKGNIERDEIFLARCQRVDEWYKLVNELSDSLIEMYTETKRETELMELSEVSEKNDVMYFEIMRIKNRLSNNVKINAKDESNNRTPRAPIINLPVFNSNIENWNSFHDMFVSLIHENSGYTDIEKFHYLRTSIKGFALSFVNLPLISDNYNIAWNTLCGHYTNSRIQFECYMNKMFQCKSLVSENAGQLSELYYTFNENILALSNMKSDKMLEQVWGFIFINKLDESTRRIVESKLGFQEIPSINRIFEIIQSQLQVLKFSRQSTSHVKRNNQKSDKGFVGNIRQLECYMCKGSHTIHNCDAFINKSVSERRDIVSKLKLCFCCFGKHLIKDCKSNKKCQTCDRKHNLLLHTDNSSVVGICHKGIRGNESIVGQVILGTIIGYVQGKDGQFYKAKCLVDSGSQVTLMSGRFCRNIGFYKTKGNSISLTTLSSTNIDVKGSTNFCLFNNKYNKSLFVKSVVVDALPSNLPRRDLSHQCRALTQDLELADNEFWKSSNIDILLGADIYGKLFTGNCKKLSEDLYAFETIFGFVILGQDFIQDNNELLTCFVSSDALDEKLKGFWEIEEVNSVSTSKKMSHLDEECVQLYSDLHYRQDDGRYVVPLLIKGDNQVPFVGTFGFALKRLNSMERKFSRNVEIKLEYVKFMKEYERLGHMNEVPIQGDTNVYYIPHHCVLKPDSLSTKLRVVFDGSSNMNATGALNKYLHVGPKLQKDINELLLRFRIYKIGFSADIKKMYRQISIRQEDRRYQHVLWREDTSQPVKEYELCTVTYGLGSSPFNAIQTINQLALDEHDKYPLGAKTLRDSTYVDDIICGHHNIDDAIILRDQLVSILRSGCFELSKWATNCPEFIQDFNKSDSSVICFAEDSNNIKLLGIKWDFVNDVFSYQVKKTDIEYTKRMILSVISSIYDPIGWITPFTFLLKVFIQTLWKMRLGWDDIIPESMQEQWNKIVNQMSLLEEFKLSRFYGTRADSQCYLVGFSDASNDGYGAVCYLVTENSNQVSLVTAKSKVAPIKMQTIPRLELCGALLLSKLIKYALSVFQDVIVIKDVYMYTDSSIVLSWLKTPTYLLKLFVANRIERIWENVPHGKWSHVRSQLNPADCASRGLYPEELVDHTLWLNGPEWLSDPVDRWPRCDDYIVPAQQLPEYKGLVNQSNALIFEDKDRLGLYKITNKYSKLTRIVAWIIRFKINCRLNANERNKGDLCNSELESSLQAIIKYDQSLHFMYDIKMLKSKNQCDNSQLQRLNCFIDKQGLVRVGGRIRYSSLPDNMKFPILLHKHSEFGKLLINYFHISYLHVGPRSLQHLIQRRYWIVSARNRIKSILSKCLVCKRFSASPVQPMMADLPAIRVTRHRPFINISIDLGGPFILKENKRRNSKTYKAYFCVFVCMTTKAIHIEIVNELSTSAFIACLERFVSRRGLCTTVYSDCGTNLVGTRKYLTGVFKFYNDCIQDTDFRNYCLEKCIDWRLNPPKGPHFGGLHEINVRSIKYHLKRVVGNQVMTYEEFNTVLIKIEAVVNSRPLVPMCNDIDSVDALTPAHFLISEVLVGIPEYDVTDINLNRLDRWQMITRMYQDFWKRWSVEYLTSLQQRKKWFTSVPNLQLGDLVLLKEEKLHPLHWKLGRIVATMPGKDNVVRVVKVKTREGVFVRPVVKICPLDV